MAVPKKVLKRQTLRNIEYYGLQEIFDELYQKSLENRKFRNLMELILMEENIKLAYRNMKKNDGSTTPGVDGKTIEHLAKMTEKEVIELVRNKLEWYTPKAIRRVEIDDPEAVVVQKLESDAYFSGDKIQMCLQKALQTLPEKQRMVFNLKYYQEMKYEEMSEIFGTSVGALKASYHHAVKKIEKFLEDID